MRVHELLEAYNDHYYTDVVIYDNSQCELINDNNILATWNYKEHNDWYCGQLDYFTTRDINPLRKWFDYRVKTFEVINDFELNGINCIYIAI